MKLALSVILSFLPSPIKVVFFRIRGNTIGKKVKIGFGAVLNVQGIMYIGTGSSIGPFTYIKSTNLRVGRFSKISSFTYINTPEVTVGNDSLISSFVIIRSGHISNKSLLYVGDLVHIFPFVTLDCSRNVIIGDETGIGPHCSVFTHSSFKSVLEGYPVVYGDVEIGKRVELTYQVFVAPGVSIGDDAICAYGSYVNKDIPKGVLAAGMPAQIKRTKEQIATPIESIDAADILQKIILEYSNNITLVNRRQPIKVQVFVNEDFRVMENNTVYVSFDSKLLESTSTKYSHFNISTKECTNFGIHPADFQGFRKFLSRYGIRFLTQEENNK